MRSRAGLIAAALAVQAVTLGVGGYVAYRAAQESFAQSVEQIVADQNRQFADTLAEIFAQEIDDIAMSKGNDLSMLKIGTPEWDRLQTLVERDALTALPAGAFACLVDVVKVGR